MRSIMSNHEEHTHAILDLVLIHSARHISRHDKRDEEAGGPGLGVLKTRKRTRRAHDGTIVVRPSQRELQSIRSATQSSSNSSSSSSGLDLVGEEKYGEEEEFQAQGGLISPPTSGTDFASLSLEEPDPLLAPMMPGGPFEPFMEPIPGQFDAADGSFSVGLGGMTDSLGLDTATDFNLPFAATCNYNWLFDVAYLDDAFHHFDFPLGSDTEACSDVQMDLACQSTSNYDGPSALLEVASMMQTGEATQRTPAPDVSPGILEMEWMCGTSFLGQTQSPRLPRLSEISRQGILSLVLQISPMVMDGQPLSLDSPLLTLQALQGYCDLFFTRFNVTYPLIHQPTFNPDTVDPVFLASVLFMGATYSTREAHWLAVARPLGITNGTSNRLLRKDESWF
ncbi:Transcription factor [Penicillium occitanis (nom. inval.)]|nr:Transcription factor [Penicillium occitanis (nom. inval.)]PCG99933.1 hypothetical protein PENOC_055690 [Penicillium occitanis (nom. inval.)]